MKSNDSRIHKASKSHQSSPRSSRAFAERSGGCVESPALDAQKMGTGNPHTAGGNAGSPLADLVPITQETEITLTPEERQAVSDLIADLLVSNSFDGDRATALADWRRSSPSFIKDHLRDNPGERVEAKALKRELDVLAGVLVRL